ncbi:MAG: TonB-dependent receptor [Campylobacteraceae bacterium]|nr:TonB-dependent receptor [Campylobacteraceae bacterium]
MKKLALLSLAAALTASEPSVNLALSDFKPLKNFGPPPLITPNIAQSYMVENQFDQNNRQNRYYVTNLLDNSMRPFHLSSGFYGKSFYNSGLFKYRDSNTYVNLNLHHTNANSYKDGAGKRVNFGYERFGQSMVLGYLPTELSEIRLTVLHDNIKDDKQPQHGADAVDTDRLVTKLNLRLGEADFSNTLSYEFLYRKVEREANNFKLRTSPNNFFANMDRDVYENSLKYDYGFGKFHNTFGLSFVHDDHLHKRYAKAKFGNVLNAYRYADVTNKTFGIFDTISYKFDDFHKLSFGLEYLYNDAKVGKYNAKLAVPKPMQMMTGKKFFPNAKNLWKQYYGIDFDGSVDDDILNLALKYDFTPNSLDTYSLEIARKGRFAENLERFSALFAPNPAGFFVANPLLKPEYHNYAKLSFDIRNEAYKGYLNSLNGDGLNFGGYLMIDKVDNLIILDRARGQNGVKAKNLGVISRNVDALILSSHLYANYNFAQNYALNLGLYYTYAENETDNRPLYQIRPFEANLGLDYMDYASFGSYNIGVNFRYVGKQTRGDFDKKTGLGIDLKEASKEFFTTDIYAGIEFKNKVGVRLGVNNLFDKEYAEFISGSHVEAVAPNLVNAPGRTFYLSVHANF